MSTTDLQLRQDLPRIRVPAINLQSCSGMNGNTKIIHIQEEVERQSEECSTPTSEEHKIPAILSCPPAPRKPKRRVSCKRKLSDEFDFFEIVNRAEVESFFQSSFEALAKRRCPCPL